ncbi:predicted protein [Naegleria gruberi]|uniref:Predicted protein n=1 Tax=Naegleria gruberi TaxID=5762 RepID=D2VTU1_NAEGR|nr:uncharacterized protein NAEGRDRAFT_52199 [Naegleria gruberi]EFC39711.1 predicted protein [Naegleria gruberi]|eukprot:XP_002672455.1 predicted protein [Naegleria gruberi strain NEG-M]
MNEKYKLYCEGTRNGANLQEAFTSQRFPSVALRKNSFFSQALDDDQIGDDELLPLSMVCSGGESKSYSLYFFEGSESRWFFKEKKYVFEVLFNQMRPRAESHWSRLMNRVVLLHDNGPLFEMMDGRLFLFDIHTGLLSCFFIERSSQIRVIGSGLMSNIIMVQTTEGKIIKKHFNREPKEVVIDDPSPVKLFSCFCRDLQIIVLENNKFYIIKDGSSKESHYGFASYGFDVPVEVATPLFNSGIKKVSSGYRHCVVLLENGQVFTRGFNYHNQCANGDDTDIEEYFKLGFQNLDYNPNTNVNTFSQNAYTKYHIVHIQSHQIAAVPFTTLNTTGVLAEDETLLNELSQIYETKVLSNFIKKNTLLQEVASLSSDEELDYMYACCSDDDLVMMTAWNESNFLLDETARRKRRIDSKLASTVSISTNQKKSVSFYSKLEDEHWLLDQLWSDIPIIAIPIEYLDHLFLNIKNNIYMGSFKENGIRKEVNDYELEDLFHLVGTEGVLTMTVVKTSPQVSSSEELMNLLTMEQKDEIVQAIKKNIQVEILDKLLRFEKSSGKVLLLVLFILCYLVVGGTTMIIESIRFLLKLCRREHYQSLASEENSIQKLLKETEFREMLRVYSRNEHSIENLALYEVLEQIRKSGVVTHKNLLEIHHNYIQMFAPFEINLSSDGRFKFMELLEREANVPYSDLDEIIMRELLINLTDTISRLETTSEYEDWLETKKLKKDIELNV